ncbi:MAG: sigma-70 family RNA polymerase sigma factor [Christensenellaceae bacterium]|nr:sigma-70 family RNA polymerase sigma factor [Christensenellaceae bacterium]
MLDDCIQAYGQRLFALCCKLCQNRPDAEDLYQETWLRAYQKSRRLAEVEDQAGYIARICINVFRDGLRRKKLAGFFSLSSEAAQGYVDSRVHAPPPEAGEGDRLVRQAVDSLKEPYRTAAILYYFEDQSVEKAARLLDVPPGTMKSRLARARAALKEMLQDG